MTVDFQDVHREVVLFVTFILSSLVSLASKRRHQSSFFRVTSMAVVKLGVEVVITVHFFMPLHWLPKLDS